MQKLDAPEGAKVFEGEIPEGWIGIDIGPKTIELYCAEVAKSATILWNGPLGKFEDEPYSKGTKAIANTMAASKGVTVVGISTDAPAKLAKFAQRDQLNFTLLSDEDHNVADAFGVWGEKKFMGKVYDGLHRISFLIAKDGKVEQVFDSFKTKDHHQVVLNYLG